MYSKFLHAQKCNVVISTSGLEAVEAVKKDVQFFTVRAAIVGEN
jgi:hypothetical protein